MVLLALLSALLVGCGRSPPSAELKAAVERGIRGTRMDLIDTAPPGVAVVDVKIKDLKLIKSATRENAGLPVYEGNWSAKLRFNEPHAWVLVMIDGTKVVRTVAKKGEQLEFNGSLHAALDEDDEKWRIGASVAGDPFQPLIAKVTDSNGTAPIFGYSVVTSGAGTRTTSRGVSFQPHSRLGAIVEENSEEMKKLIEASNEAARKAQEAAAARQQQQREEREAEQRRVQAEREEQQRLAREQAEERRRLAEEEAKREAEARRRARLLPFVQPFTSSHGAAVISDAGIAMGAVILTADVDEENFAVKGSGIDLREMPFREFTFDAAINDRGALVYTTSLTPITIDFTRATDSGISASGGVSLSPLGSDERARVDDLIATGKRLEAATPAALHVEVLGAEDAKSRPADLSIDAIPGTIIFRDRVDTRIAPLFAGDISRGTYSWRQETLSLRLPQPVAAKGLLIRGARTPSDNLLVVINGVHRVRIEAVARDGAAIVTLPPNTEIFDLRFEALGAANSRGIAIIK
jgi:hypothetical protein